MPLLSGEKYLVVSFHDLAPPCQDLCNEFIETLRGLGIPRVSLLVVPKWHDGPWMTRDSRFTDWLLTQAEAGHEIVLHGLTHLGGPVRGGLIAHAVARIYTAREGEFYQISYDEANHRISQGLDLFRRAGLPVEGFTAPAWLLSDNARQALKDLNLLYTTTWGTIEVLPVRRIYRAPVLAFSSRSRLRRWISRLWIPVWFQLNRNASILRLAVHPIDLKYSAVRETIYNLVRRLAPVRSVVTYAELARRILE